jgi:hypothetical protein
MKNKVFFVKQLCELKKLDLESPEAKELYNLKIVDLLIAIKQAKPPGTEPGEPGEPEDEQSLAQLLGCT